MRQLILSLSLIAAIQAGDPATVTAAPGIPVECQELPADSWKVFEEDQLRLYGEGRLVTRIKDPTAADGRSAEIAASHTEWAVQFPTPERFAAKGKRTRCILYVKVLTTNPTKPTSAAFQAGLWNDQPRGHVARITPDLPAGQTGFVAYDLGVHELSTSMYLYLAPSGATGVTSVTIDRVLFIDAP
jgi:hypothetical protein